MIFPLRPRPSALLLFLLATGCGNKDPSGPAASASNALAASAAPSASNASAIAPAPPSPFSVVLESKAPLVLSGLEGGVWISDETRAHAAKAIGAADLSAMPMPEGLPTGPGRILGVHGRLPHAVWLS